MDCSFCSKGVERGTGLLYVKRDGTVLSFCSGKCKKNMLKLKRNPKRVLWLSKKQKPKPNATPSG